MNLLFFHGTTHTIKKQILLELKDFHLVNFEHERKIMMKSEEVILSQILWEDLVNENSQRLFELISNVKKMVVFSGETSILISRKIFVIFSQVATRFRFVNLQTMKPIILNYRFFTKNMMIKHLKFIPNLCVGVWSEEQLRQELVFSADKMVLVHYQSFKIITFWHFLVILLIEVIWQLYAFTFITNK